MFAQSSVLVVGDCCESCLPQAYTWDVSCTLTLRKILQADGNTARTSEAVEGAAVDSPYRHAAVDCIHIAQAAQREQDLRTEVFACSG
mmetsp:Transcript_37258/g.96698  ORF Transcript_37258/g.96698 Transcript_37258/m.96698 type:complete len:88 (+) Transcript_37258:2443-2706(+)